MSKAPANADPVLPLTICEESLLEADFRGATSRRQWTRLSPESADSVYGAKRDRRFDPRAPALESGVVVCALLALQACSPERSAPQAQFDASAPTPPSAGTDVHPLDSSRPGVETSQPVDAGVSSTSRPSDTLPSTADQQATSISDSWFDSSSSDAGPCAAGTRRCAPSGVEVCKADGSHELVELCKGETPGCHQGTCTACIPNQRACFGNAPRVCTEDGSGWRVEPTCDGNAPACIEATGTCSKCQPSDRQCSGGVVQKCGADGAWELERTCGGDTPVCSAALTACAECEPATRECLGATTPRLCDPSGRWLTQPECGGFTPVCSDALGVCGCKDDTRRCSGNQPELCRDGSWVPLDVCPTTLPLCDPSDGACVCDSDTRDCTSDGVPSLCVDGAWVEQQACPTDTPLCASGECWCADGSERCDGDDHELCVNGRWQPSPCSDDTSCDQVTGSCACTATEPECVGSTPRTCVEGAWVSGETCRANTQECVAGECQCVDDSINETTLVEDPTLGCGQRWDIAADEQQPWTVFDSKVHFDETTSLLWYQAGGQRNVEEAVQYCGLLSVVGYDDWRLPTIDDVRQLVDGCAVMETGGGCLLSTSCTETSCNASASCTRCEAGEGPHETGFYLRPNVRITGVVLTSTECSDCSPARVWVYYPEGYFTRLATDVRQPTYCVRLND